jgi:hypothetical protein
VAGREAAYKSTGGLHLTARSRHRPVDYPAERIVKARGSPPSTGIAGFGPSSRPPGSWIPAAGVKLELPVKTAYGAAHGR